MDDVFTHLAITDIHNDVLHNIVSLRVSQNLFDDLTDSEQDWALAQQIEMMVKPPLYQSVTPALHRPFEDAKWFNAIDYPYKNWQVNRFSDGSYGVWYGSDSVATTVYETAYHWYHDLLCDAGFEREAVVAERKVYSVACDAALLDFRALVNDFSGLRHKTDYSYTHAVGARIHREGYPGLLTQSARCECGENYAIFNASVLSNPRDHCFLTYTLQDDSIVIEKTPGRCLMKISLESSRHLTQVCEQ